MAMTHEEKMGLIPLKTKEQISTDLDSLDARLEAALEGLIREKSDKVRVVAKDGLVTLVGYAPDTKVKRDIAQATKAMPGVREVTNHIKILPEEV